MEEMRYDRWGLKRDNPRVSLKDAFVLNQRIYAGVRPDGDGWELVEPEDYSDKALWVESQWNLTKKRRQTQKNPLNLQIRIKPPRKQTAARMVRPIESMDDRHVYIVDAKNEEPNIYFDLGRNGGEVRPHTAQQSMKSVNFELGGKYSGGTKAIREAMQKRKEYMAGPKKQTAEEVRNSKIVELENRVRELLGLLKK